MGACGETSRVDGHKVVRAGAFPPDQFDPCGDHRCSAKEKQRPYAVELKIDRVSIRAFDTTTSVGATYGHEYQRRHDRSFWHRQILDFSQACIFFSTVGDQTRQPRRGLADILHHRGLRVVHGNKYHGQVDDVDNDYDHHDYDPPLHCDGFLDSSVRLLRCDRLHTSVVWRQTP